MDGFLHRREFEITSKASVRLKPQIVTDLILVGFLNTHINPNTV